MSSLPDNRYSATAALAATAGAIGLSAGITALTASPRRFEITQFNAAIMGAAGVISTSAVATIESPSSTVLWQQAINTPAPVNVTFNPPLPAGPTGQSVVFRLAGLSAAAYLTVNGVAIGKTA